MYACMRFFSWLRTRSPEHALQSSVSSSFSGLFVVVHEFGHYFFARLFGVKAEIFSIGFGPKIWSRQMGETELARFGDSARRLRQASGRGPRGRPESGGSKRALHQQAPWKRFFIFFGGPLFNFIFAIVVFMVILAVGEPQIANVVGRVVDGSAAEHAGFVSGDRIVAIDGKPVREVRRGHQRDRRPSGQAHDLRGGPSRRHARKAGFPSRRPSRTASASTAKRRTWARSTVCSRARAPPGGYLGSGLRRGESGRPYRRFRRSPRRPQDGELGDLEARYRSTAPGTELTFSLAREKRNEPDYTDVEETRARRLA